MPLGASRLAYLAKTSEAAAARSTITAFGDAQISDAQAQFGASSAYFDGTGDYLEITNQIGWVLTSDFTIEFWIRFASTSGTQNILHNRENGDYNVGNFTINSNGSTLRVQGEGISTLEASISANTWYHVSVNRVGSDLNLKLNGSNVGSNYVTTFSSDFGSTSYGTLYLGAADGGSSAFNGWIDELRISDNARYSSAIPFGSFTVPTSAFTNDANTLLLMHADGANGSTDFTDDNS